MSKSTITTIFTAGLLLLFSATGFINWHRMRSPDEPQFQTVYQSPNLTPVEKLALDPETKEKEIKCSNCEPLRSHLKNEVCPKGYDDALIEVEIAEEARPKLYGACISRKFTDGQP
jgi:hypothetical protein